VISVFSVVQSLVNVSEIADVLEAGLRRAFEQRDIEQAVYGLDVQDELALHPVIEHILREAGYGVHREQRYPADRLTSRLRLSTGERCDFVLTPDNRPLMAEELRGTLFDSPQSIALDEAFWLEVKVVSQFTLEGPNANYSSQLLSCVRQDVTKLSKDAGILKAGLLIIMFVRDEIVADHDLNIWQDRCLSRGLPIGAPSVRRIPMTDRHGHGLCVIALYPVSHL
jgi:hypothetical protein